VPEARGRPTAIDASDTLRRAPGLILGWWLLSADSSWQRGMLR